MTHKRREKQLKMKRKGTMGNEEEREKQLKMQSYYPKPSSPFSISDLIKLFSATKALPF